MLNRKTKILFYADSIWFFGEGMLGPLFAIFAQRIGGNILDISWAWATYLIVAGLAIVLVGKISDKYISKEKLLVLGFALNALFTFGYLFVLATWHLFIIQIGLGLAAALASPTWNALYSQYGDKKQFGYAWGLSDGLAQLLTGIAIVIGGFIVSYFSFTALFIVMGAIQIVAAIWQFQILRK